MTASVLSSLFEHQHPRSRLVVGAEARQQLPGVIADLGSSKVFVICGRTVANGPQLALVREILGDTVVGVFDGVRPQGGSVSLHKAADQVAASGADVVISVGGGAAMDSAKYVILLHSTTHPLDDYAVPKGEGRDARPRRALTSTAYPHIAIPTTAGSSSEIMPWAGVRDEARSQKVLFRDPLLVPDVALLDPHFVQFTGPGLTATSGSTALARAVETLYSVVRQPIADAYALHALRLLLHNLPRTIENGKDLDARLATQIGALLSGIAADNSMVSLVHAVGHAVGGRYGLQHGLAHSILLPAASELLLPAAPDALPQIADAIGEDAMGLPTDKVASAISARLSDTFNTMPIPRRLRDVGVPAEDLDDIATHAMHEPMMGYCPRAISRGEVLEVLRGSW